jgi:hypothetical protein
MSNAKRAEAATEKARASRLAEVPGWERQARAAARPRFLVRRVVVTAGFLMALSGPAAAWAATPTGPGSVYGVLSDGRLTYAVIDSSTGDRTHTVVSSAKLGFTPKAMATLNFNTILVTSTGGQLYRVDIKTNNTSLTFDTPVHLGGGWTHDLLAASRGGLADRFLYGIADGTLRRYNITSEKPGSGNIVDNTLIDTGFTLTTLTATGPDWILGLTSAGVLRSYHIVGPNNWFGYTLDDRFCCFTHLLSPGGGVYYGRTSGGAMYRYADAALWDGDGGDIKYFPDDPVDTGGWTQTLLSAQPGTVTVAPPRDNGLTKPIYLIHGYNTDNQPINVKGAYWNEAIADYLHDDDPERAHVVWAWCYYSNDVNCDLKIPGDRNRSIRLLGQDLAWDIYMRYSRYGMPVDVLGHSMGGLVIRAAIFGTQRQEGGFPPCLYVEDVTTLATPHAGLILAPLLCSLLDGPLQCREMRAGSSFLDWLREPGGRNPQAASGTDWTLIGFDDDLVVPAGSAVPADMPVGHKVIYPDRQFLPALEAHMLPLSRTSGHHRMIYCDYFGACDMSDRDSWSQLQGEFDPILVARYGNAYYSSW